MKKIILICLLIICLKAKSQVNFQFDLYTDYLIVESINQKSGKKEVILSNSLNKSLSLKIYVDKKGKPFGILLDSEQNKSHYFKVALNPTSSLKSEDFIYDYSVEWSKMNCFQNDYTYEVVEQDSSAIYNIKINSFINNEKSTSLFLKTEITNFNFSNNFKFGYLHHFDNCEKIQIKSNVLVYEAEFLSLKGVILQKVKLLNYGTISLNIIIEKLKYTDSNTHFYRGRYFSD